MTATVIGPGGTVILRDRDDPTRRAIVDATGALKVFGALGGGGGDDLATETTLSLVLTALNTAVTGLGLINQNTDELEDLIEGAYETLVTIDADQGAQTSPESASGNGTEIGILKNLRTRLQAVQNSTAMLDALLSTRASESTLGSRASEATLALLEGKDFATEETLARQVGPYNVPLVGTRNVTGQTTLLTPASGERVRVRRIWIKGAHAMGDNAVEFIVKLGDTEIAHDEVIGDQPYADGVVKIGDVDAPLTLELLAGGLKVFHNIAALAV